MGDLQTFPDDPKDFLMDHSFVDSKQYYTNGASLIPVFRVEQMIDHYFRRSEFNLDEFLEDLSKLLYEDTTRVDQRYWNAAIKRCVDLVKVHQLRLETK